MEIFIRIVLLVFCIFSTMKSVSRMIILFMGHKALDRLKTQAKQTIKLKNLQDSKSSLIRTLIVSVIMCAVLLFFFFVAVIKADSLILIIAFGLITLNSVFNVITTWIAYKNIDECYITPEGIFFNEGFLRREQFHFSMETGLSRKVTNKAGSSKIINVYKENAAYALRFQIIDNSKEVIGLINSFSIPQNMIERVTVMEQYFDEVTAYMNIYDEKEGGITSDIAHHIQLLEAYYDGGLWRMDYEADENGELPVELKRGVLSQDGLYDLLTATNRI